jgi:thiol-disulfide isomerase/thioredoxin
MAGRKSLERVLDIVVGLTAALALLFLVRERVLPWVAERSVIDPGEEVPAEPWLVDAETGDSVFLQPGAAQLLLVFRSTCPTCERAVPAWNRLSKHRAWTTTAVGLEGADAAAGYAGERLPEVLAAVPRDIERFTTRFRIGVVPTTLVIDRGGRLVARHAGPLEESDIEALRRHVEPSTP